MNDSPGPAQHRPWYSGVSTYQWLILVIACAGWMFDTYEAQIFGLTGSQLFKSLIQTTDLAEIQSWKNTFFGVFLLGGAVGGLLFGILADRIGRKPTMVATILFYSVFSGLTYFAQSASQVAVLRFLVAMGTGGEWAVAASLVAEVFPTHARAHASGIFHASSVIGTWIATAAALAVGANWRYAYLIGVVPAILVAWIIASVKEPDRWQHAKEGPNSKPGSMLELLGHEHWRKRAILGMLLAAVGLSCYWAVHVAGQALAERLLLAQGASSADAAQKSKWAYGFIETFGGILGLLAFGPLCNWLGRKRAFTWSQVAAFLFVPIICYAPLTFNQFLCLMPVFGFLTLCMHAGYAIYFPELFPTRLRATGTSFCFNVARVLAAGMMFFSASYVKKIDVRLSVSLAGILFLLGVVIVQFMPETKGKPLPE